MSSPAPHIVLIGTGLTSLSIARSLLLASPSPSFTLTLLDKAKNPGGRLTTRTYDSGVVLETGARVFESSKEASSNGFGKEVERWEKKGFVRSVQDVKGVKGEVGKWWEGVGGLSRGLIGGLMDEIEEAAKGRVEFRWNVTAANPTPVDPTASPLQLTLDPPQSLAPISYLVHTAPSPQTSILLPSSASASASSTTYLKTFALLLPTINLPSAPIYHRDPHPSLNSIATGLASSTSSEARGLVIQSTPEKLSLAYTKDESSDADVRRALFRILRENRLLPEEILIEAEKKEGRESQVKRWKFAQVERATELRQGGYEEEGKRVIALEGERVILAGDGTVGGAGGVEGAWLAAMDAVEVLKKWLGEEAKSKI